jgi:hypothetical protein
VLRAAPDRATPAVTPPPAGVPELRAVALRGQPPVIDGRLDDQAWASAPEQGGFVERRPRLDRAPPVGTAFRLLVSRSGVFLGVRCQDGEPGRLRATVRGRDSLALLDDDAITVQVDPAHDHRTTLGFALNLEGTQLDYRGVNEEAALHVEFDAVWQGRARRAKDGWTAELFLPWSSLGLDGARPPSTLGLNLTRYHAQRTAVYDWALLAPPFSPLAASRFGRLVGADRALAASEAADRAPRPPSSSRWRDLALVPYLLGGYRSLRPTPSAGLHTAGEFEAGGDVIVGPGAGGAWRGQLTINTDFSQVDLDSQVVNLSRFGLFMPEKRDFFTRDAELLAFGRPEQDQPLYTRRIGLSRNDGLAAVPLLCGLKLIGQAPGGVRAALLHVITRPGGGDPWNSQLVGRSLVELEGGSNVGLIVTHRQALERDDDYDIVLGLDGAWRGQHTPLLVSGYGMVSWTGAGAGAPAEAVGALATGTAVGRPAPAASLDLSWRGRTLRPNLNYTYIDRQLRADLGFLQRVGIHRLSAGVVIEPRIERGGVEKLTSDNYATLIADARGGEVLDGTLGSYDTLVFDTGLHLDAWVELLRERVLEAFAAGGVAAVEPGSYDMARATLSAGTPTTWPLSLALGGTWRCYYGGTLLGLSAEVNARPHPLFRFVLTASFNQMRFAGTARDFHAALITATLTLGLTRDLVLDSVVAWNELEARLRCQSPPALALWARQRRLPRLPTRPRPRGRSQRERRAAGQADLLVAVAGAQRAISCAPVRTRHRDAPRARGGLS